MQILLWAGLIVPRVSLVFINKNDIKRYMPVTVLCCFILTIIFEIAYTYEWWTIHHYILP